MKGKDVLRKVLAVIVLVLSYIFLGSFIINFTSQSGNVTETEVVFILLGIGFLFMGTYLWNKRQKTIVVGIFLVLLGTFHFADRIINYSGDLALKGMLFAVPLIVIGIYLIQSYYRKRKTENS